MHIAHKRVCENYDIYLFLCIRIYSNMIVRTTMPLLHNPDQSVIFA